jgi:hypothetical protein
VFGAVFFFLVLLALIFSISARAEEPVRVRFQVLPPGEEMTLGSKGKARCYFLSDWLQLAKADNELYTLRAESDNLREIVRLLQEKQKNLHAVNQSLFDDKTILLERSRSLETDIKDCRSRLASCGSYAPWVIAIIGGTMGVIGVAIGIGAWMGS